RHEPLLADADLARRTPDPTRRSLTNDGCGHTAAQLVPTTDPPPFLGKPESRNADACVHPDLPTDQRHPRTACQNGRNAAYRPGWARAPRRPAWSSPDDHHGHLEGHSV